MEVKVLGPGCSKCKKLYQETEKAITHACVEATLIKVEKIDEIMMYGVMATPSLVIDGEVKCSGRIPNVAEIVSWLTTASMKS